MLGNLEAERDWGYAPDYVNAMWLMLQADLPDDYVVASGETHSVREFVEMVFNALDLDYEQYVHINPKFYRPAEIVPLRGEPARVIEKLGWGRSRDLSNLVKEMIAAEMNLYETSVDVLG